MKRKRPMLVRLLESLVNFGWLWERYWDEFKVLGWWRWWLRVEIVVIWHRWRATNNQLRRKVHTSWYVCRIRHDLGLLLLQGKGSCGIKLMMRLRHVELRRIASTWRNRCSLLGMRWRVVWERCQIGRCRLRRGSVL